MPQNRAFISRAQPSQLSNNKQVVVRLALDLKIGGFFLLQLPTLRKDFDNFS
jgi:hypothetical protein